MKNQNQPVIKRIPTINTPSKYTSNYSRVNNSAIELNPEYFLQKEKNPSPTLKPQSSNSNNINEELSPILRESDINDDTLKNLNFSMKNIYLSNRNQKSNNVKERYPSNYSYYESKYTKKVSTPGNQRQNSNINLKQNTHKVINNNAHSLYYSNDKIIGLGDSHINNTLIQSLDRSHVLSPIYYSKDNTNGYNTFSPMKKNSEMFYSKISQNKVNYFQKSAIANQKKNPNTIIYRDYHKNANNSQKIMQPRTPSTYSQYKVISHQQPKVNINQTIQKYDNKTEKNINNLISKSLESIAFTNQLKNLKNIDINNNKSNNNINFKQNNFKKVVKYTNKNNQNNQNNQNGQNIQKNKSVNNSIEPFRLSHDEINDKPNNKNSNNNINNTVVNITYINENKNYIKNVYTNDVLKPMTQDKFILDNENDESKKEQKKNINKTINFKHLSNERRTPSQGIKVMITNKMRLYTPMNEKMKTINYQTKTIEKKINPMYTKINENHYLKKIGNITQDNKNINHNYKTHKEDKVDNHNLINDINISKKQNDEKEESISLNIKRKKDKSVERDYELIYNAKIIESKYRKKSSEKLISNISEKDTITVNKTYYPKTAIKSNNKQANKSFINNINTQTNYKVSTITSQNINKINKETINPPSNISKITITNISTKNPKIIKIKNKEEKKEKGIIDNKFIKINQIKGKEKESRKKTYDAAKNNNRRGKDKEKVNEKKQEKKEKIIYVKSCYGITLAGRNEKGIKKTNQDTFIIEKNVNGIENFNIFGVLDGHGDNGHLASNFVKNYIIEKIKNNPSIKHLKEPEKIYKSIISNGYQFLAKIYLDADIEIQHQDFDPSRSGTTCILIIQILNHIICSNTGDSRAMIVYDSDDNLFQSQIYPLSYDCKPELPNERKRIMESGGVVEKAYYSDDEDGENSGPYRVWAYGEDYPGLAMSRSIGDMDAKKVGVIPNPQIVEYTIDKNSKYFIIASDGIWEFITNEECMKFANPFYMRNDCVGLCKELSQKATNLWITKDIIIDDITCVAGFF